MTHLFIDVLTEAVTISVVQLLRVVMWRLLSAHVVDCAAGTMQRSTMRIACFDTAFALLWGS